MPVDKNKALAEIDAIEAERSHHGNRMDSTEAHRFITLYRAAINRLAPPGSEYLEEMTRVVDHSLKVPGETLAQTIEAKLRGVLAALRADYDADRMQTFQELVHAELFADFLEMAQHLLDEGYKDPAAVMTGGVLEEHLRKLCAKHGVMLPPRATIEPMNQELAKKQAYSKIDRHSVTAWAAIRNAAAHGNYGDYQADEVNLMIEGVRQFIARNPA